MPRHGPGHRYPAHRVNYRANLWALRQAGVRAIFGPSACGSLRPELAPGDVVVCDQLVDRTSGRADTYFDTVTNHVSLADPYCDELRQALLGAARTEGMTAHDGGTMTVISGPRFSTRAESRWFRGNGWDVVGMTQYPRGRPGRRAGHLLRHRRPGHRLRRRPGRRPQSQAGHPGRGVRLLRREPRPDAVRAVRRHPSRGRQSPRLLRAHQRHRTASAPFLKPLPTATVKGASPC